MKDQLNNPSWKMKILYPFVAGVVLGIGFEVTARVTEAMYAREFFNEPLSLGYLVISLAVLYLVIKVLSWLLKRFGYKGFKGEISFELVNVVSLLMGSFIGYLFVGLVALSLKEVF